MRGPMISKAFAVIAGCLCLFTVVVLGHDGPRGVFPVKNLKIVGGGTLSEDGTLAGAYGASLRSSRSAPGQYEVAFDPPLRFKPVIFAVSKAGDDVAIVPVTVASSRGFRLESPFQGPRGSAGEKISFTVGLRPNARKQGGLRPAP